MILSISPESSKPERAFSGAYRIYLWDRLWIKYINIKRVEYIRSWLYKGYIISISRGRFGLLIIFSILKGDLINLDNNLKNREDIN